MKTTYAFYKNKTNIIFSFILFIWISLFSIQLGFAQCSQIYQGYANGNYVTLSLSGDAILQGGGTQNCLNIPYIMGGPTLAGGNSNPLPSSGTATFTFDGATNNVIIFVAPVHQNDMVSITSNAASTSITDVSPGSACWNISGNNISSNNICTATTGSGGGYIQVTGSGNYTTISVTNLSTQCNGGLSGTRGITTTICQESISLGCTGDSAYITKGSSTPECIGQSHYFVLHNVAIGSTINWNFGSGASPATQTQVSTQYLAWSNTVTYSTSGIKTVTATITKPGCPTKIVSFTFEIYPTPAAPPLNAVTHPICPGDLGSVSFNTNETILFSPNPVGITGSGSPGYSTYFGFPPGTYNATMVSVNGCESAPVSFTINNPNPSPAPPIIGVITQPTCLAPWGSVALSGLPAGSWQIRRVPTSGFTPINGSGTTYLLDFLNPGNYTFTVTNTTTGCTSINSNSFTINPIPSGPVLGGANNVCRGLTANVTPSIGGTWSSSNTSIASVTNSGLVTGINAGIVTLTFTETATNCTSTKSFTVVSGPIVSIPGPGTICVGGTTTLSPSTGGTWVSNNPAVASVTNAGVVTGLSAGTATFTFTSTAGCISNPTPPITVSTASASVTGLSTICVGSTTQLSPTSGGTWTSSNPTVATSTVGGLVTGLSAGTVTFTFTSTAGCVSSPTPTITVNPTNTVSNSGNATLCLGQAVSITHPTTGATGIGAASGLPTGVSAAFGSNTITISGTPTVSGIFNYTIPLTGGCGSLSAIGTININPLPSVAITGNDSICVGLTTQLSPTTGGTWASSNNAIATVSNVGLVTGVSAGSATFTFTSTATSCISNPTAAVTVSDNPTAPIIGAITQPTCVTPSGSVALSGLPASGSWTITASPVGLVLNGSGTSAVFTGLSANTTYTFTVLSSAGCVSPSSTNAVIDAIPGAPVLGGTSTVCIGQTANVTPNSGGTWSSSNPLIATVTNGGVVTGVSAGSVTLTFTDGFTGCSNTMNFIVHALPVVSITLNDTICVNDITTLSPTTGGTWVSSNPLIATVTNGGVVTGVSAGSVFFTFTNTTTGCSSMPSATVTVLPIPLAPSGIDRDTICVGQSTSLSVNLPLGTTVDWYTNPVGSGLPISSNNPLIVSPITTTTYYAFSDNGYCQSDSAWAITVEVLSIPSIPSGIASDTICIGDSAVLFVNVASGLSVEWYDNASASGAPIFIGNPLIVSPLNTTTYYAFASNGFCLSLNDGSFAVTVHVLAIPVAPTAIDTFVICLGDSVSILATIPLGTSIEWYTDTISSPISTSNPLIVYPTSDTSFYAFANNGYCSSNDSLLVHIFVLPTPDTLSGTATDSICVGDTSVILVNLPIGLTVDWYDNPAGTGLPISNSNPLIVSPLVTTSYYAFANNGVCRSNAPFVATVSVFDIPPVALGDTAYAICIGDSVSMNILNALGWNITWYDSLGNILSNNNPFVVYPTHDTSFFVLLDNVVCSSSEALEVSIEVFEYPTLSLSTQNPNCFGQTGSITASASGGTQPYSYDWSNNSSDSIIDSLGSGIYTLTLTDSAGCSVVDSASIDMPLPIDAQINGSTTLCSNQSGIYFVTANGAISYIWSTGDTTDTISYANISSQYLYVTVTNANGCTDVDSILIQALSVPEVNILYDDTLCSYESIVFIAQGTGIDSLLWMNGQNTDSISFDPNNIPDTVWVIASNILGCSDTARLTNYPLVIHQAPIADFDTMYVDYLPSVITFTDSSSSDVISWLWNFDDNFTANIQNPKHFFETAGDFLVSLIVENQFECFDTAQMTITVGESIEIPNVFTPNGDDQNEFFIVPTSGLKNPMMIIYNRWGAKLYETQGQNLYWDGRTNAGALVPQGSYYYLITAEGSKDYVLTGIVTLLR